MDQQTKSERSGNYRHVSHFCFEFKKTTSINVYSHISVVKCLYNFKKKSTHVILYEFKRFCDMYCLNTEGQIQKLLIFSILHVICMQFSHFDELINFCFLFFVRFECNKSLGCSLWFYFQTKATRATLPNLHFCNFQFHSICYFFLNFKSLFCGPSIGPEFMVGLTI